MKNSMLNSPIRIIVDTNLWISFLIGRHLHVLLDILDNPLFELITTERLRQEILTVARRPKFQQYFGEQQIQELEHWLTYKATEIEIGEIQVHCRDPKDDYLLQLAIDAKAIYLVSGDDDLLSIGEIQGCRIMTIEQFQAEIASLI